MPMLGTLIVVYLNYMIGGTGCLVLRDRTRAPDSRPILTGIHIPCNFKVFNSFKKLVEMYCGPKIDFLI